MAVRAALGTGTPAPWDFAPAYDASRRYIRNHMDLADLEEMARFPPARGQPGGP
jgi:choline-sulfatase